MFSFNDDDSFIRNVGGLTVNSLNHIFQINKFNEDLPDGEIEIIINILLLLPGTSQPSLQGL